jgi:hypothetical protein
MTTYVVFSKPCQWWGWVIASYQLMRGVKYWQLVHCEILSDIGIYAYRINEVVHCESSPTLPTVDKLIDIPDVVPGMLSRSRNFHRKWGDFSPLSIITGRHCVKYTKYVLNIYSSARLPGQLAYELEGIYDVQHSAS